MLRNIEALDRAVGSDDPANAKRYEFLWRPRDRINQVSRIIIAADGDTAGKALRTDLIARLGLIAAVFVEYASGRKILTKCCLGMVPTPCTRRLATKPQNAVTQLLH